LNRSFLRHLPNGDLASCIVLTTSGEEFVLTISQGGIRILESYSNVRYLKISLAFVHRTLKNLLLTLVLKFTSEYLKANYCVGGIVSSCFQFSIGPSIFLLKFLKPTNYFLRLLTRFLYETCTVLFLKFRREEDLMRPKTMI